MIIINLTPHAINVGGHPAIEPSGEIARVNAQTSQVGELNGIPVIETKSNGISGLPSEKEGVVYIVPSMVRQFLPRRRDLVSPAKLLRNRSGVVIGCAGFEINAEIK
jgi:hypothetical protein